MLPPDTACNLGIQLLVGWHFQPQKHGNIITATATATSYFNCIAIALKLHKELNIIDRSIIDIDTCI